MWSYFKPVRRKIGVVALGLACVSTAVWVRSGISDDTIHLPISATSECVAIFSPHRIHVGKSELITVKENQIIRIHEGAVSFVNKVATNDSAVYLSATDVVLESDFGTIPYWLFVVPLTLLSAWFLLSKPRATNTILASEP